jgi:hypothetical protein
VSGVASGASGAANGVGGAVSGGICHVGSGVPATPGFHLHVIINKTMFNDFGNPQIN